MINIIRGYRNGRTKTIKVTLKEDTTFTTGYLGRGVPTKTTIVKAGTEVDYNILYSWTGTFHILTVKHGHTEYTYSKKLNYLVKEDGTKVKIEANRRLVLNMMIQKLAVCINNCNECDNYLQRANSEDDGNIIISKCEEEDKPRHEILINGKWVKERRKPEPNFAWCKEAQDAYEAQMEVLKATADTYYKIATEHLSQGLLNRLIGCTQREF